MERGSWEWDGQRGQAPSPGGKAGNLSQFMGRRSGCESGAGSERRRQATERRVGLDSLGHQGTTAGHWGGREAPAEAPSRCLQVKRQQTAKRPEQGRGLVLPECLPYTSRGWARVANTSCDLCTLRLQSCCEEDSQEGASFLQHKRELSAHFPPCGCSPAWE